MYLTLQALGYTSVTNSVGILPSTVSVLEPNVRPAGCSGVVLVFSLPGSGRTVTVTEWQVNEINLRRGAVLCPTPVLVYLGVNTKMMKLKHVKTKGD